MRAWTMAEVNRLREEVAKGKHGDLAGLAKSMGYPLSAVRSQVQRYKMRALKISAQSNPGLVCGVCKAEVSWDDLPSDEPVKLVAALASWKKQHLTCRRVP